MYTVTVILIITGDKRSISIAKKKLISTVTQLVLINVQKPFL